MLGVSTTTWLKAAAAIVVGFGGLVALAAHPATAGPTVLLADLIFWPIDGTATFAAAETRVMSAIGGGLMAGWGVLLWLLAARLYPREPALARTMILTSVGVWFVVDGIGSVAAGAPLNVVLNAGFLAMFVVPLWSPRKHPAVEETSGA